MDFEQAERRLHELQSQRDLGELDETAFRVEVAKLLFRDEYGVFWMLDADEATWFCNQGEGWVPGDPYAERTLEAVESDAHRAKRRRRGQVPVIILIGIVLVGAISASVLWRWPAAPWNSTQLATVEDPVVRVSIASPADGSQVILGQEVAVESTINAAPDLQVVEHVDLVVEGDVINRLMVGPKIQPGQMSLPLSQPWLSTAPGEHQVAVVAFSANGDPLAVAAVSLHVEESPDKAPPELECYPDATFVEDVTIPVGTAFLPGARLEKVWRVRNSGSCAWGVGYELALREGESLGAPGSVPVPPTAAGVPADLSITFWAPQEAGSYVAVWQLQAPDGQFFGPTLSIDIQVEVQAQESIPPAAPTDLQATVTEDSKAVRLTWTDRSDDEDAFRIYREDMGASIGLAPADAKSFVDGNVICGNAYRYTIAAFNAAGLSPVSETAEVILPPCAPTDEPPTLSLTLVPSQVLVTEPFTVSFLANDDHGLVQVVVSGEETGDQGLDEGRVFACDGVTCEGTWTLAWTHGASVTLTLVAMAADSSGSASEPARATVLILPSE
jgi:hypothetical protein